MQRLQAGIEYEQAVSNLNKLGTFLRMLDNRVTGNGSHAGWNGDNLFQFYNPGGGGFGAGISVSGRLTLVDVNTIPGQMGVSVGFGKVGRLNGRPYIRRVGSNAAVSFGLDVSKIVQNASSGFDVGSQLAGAIESVVGKGGADSRPVVQTVTSESVQAITKQVSASVMSQKEGLVEVVNISHDPDTVNTIMGYWPDDSKGITVAPKDTIDATLRDSKTGRVIKILKIWPGL